MTKRKETFIEKYKKVGLAVLALTILIFCLSLYIEHKLDSNNTVIIFVGIMGSIASTVGVLLGSKIFNLSNTSQEATNKIVEKIKNDEEEIKILTSNNSVILEEIRKIENSNREILDQIKDEESDIKKLTEETSNITYQIQKALKTSHFRGLKSITTNLNSFLNPDVDFVDNYEFYMLSDTTAFGYIHELFNPTYQNQDTTIFAEIRTKIEDTLKKSKKFQVGFLDFNEKSFKQIGDVESFNYKNYIELRSSRLINQFVEPVIYTINKEEFNIEKQEYLKKVYELLELHTYQRFSINKLAEKDNINKKVFDLRHLPYQVYIFTNDTKEVYKAFLIHIGTYNMEQIAEPSAFITFEKELVLALKSVVETFVEKQQKKIETNKKLKQYILELKQNDFTEMKRIENKELIDKIHKIVFTASIDE